MNLRTLPGGLALFVLASALGAGPVPAQQPQTPTVNFPSTGVTLNPTVFFTHYAQSGGDLRDHQRDFEVQIADAGGNNTCEDADFTGSGLEYRTNNASGSPPDCINNEPRCQGAGMAHMVSSRGAYAGIFGGDDAGRTKLRQGNRYCLRVRVLGFSPDEGASLGWSPFSAIKQFDTVSYNGSTLYVSASGDNQGGGNNCRNQSSPCRTLTQALFKVSPGDTVLVRSGLYPTAKNEIDFGNVTDRLYIRGADVNWNVDPPDGERPVLEASFTGAQNDEHIKLSGLTETIIEDIVFAGNPNCRNCAAFDPNNVNRPFVYTFTMLNMLRTSLINVDFLNNITVVAGPATDVLYWDVFMEGIPAYSNLVGAPEQKRAGSVGLVPNLQREPATRVTIKGLVSDNTMHSLEFGGSVTAPNTDILVEEIQLYRSEGHIYRPGGLNIRHTVRRNIVGDSSEGLYYETFDSSIRGFVGENNVFYGGLALCDNSGQGPIDYLVLVNNVFGGRAQASSRGTLQVQDHECGQGPTSGNILDGNDRIYLGYNVWWWTLPGDLLIRWDCNDDACAQGTIYRRCEGGPGSGTDFRAWTQRAEVFDTPIGVGGCFDGDDDSVDPLFVFPVVNDPLAGRVDVTPASGSPLINAGAPGYLVPEGGGNRVDIGAVEVQGAPVFRILDPPPASQCAPEGTSQVILEVEDLQDGINLASIDVSVTIDGASVGTSFTTSDDGGSNFVVTVTVTSPVGIPAGSVAAVQISASDLSGESSSATFSFRVQSPAPTGVGVS